GVEATGIRAGNMNGRVETSGMIAVPVRVSDEIVDKTPVTLPIAGRPAPPRLPRIAVAVPSDDTSRLPTGSDGMPGSAGRPGTERPDNTVFTVPVALVAVFSTEPASSVEATGISAGNMNGRVETSGRIAVPVPVSDESVDKTPVTLPIAGRPAPPDNAPRLP